MMMRTAGGPGLDPRLNPLLNASLGRKPVPRTTTLAAIGAVALVHLGVGVVLYHQRFEPAPVLTLPEPPTILVDVIRPRPKPPVPTKVPPAPSPPIHRSLAAPTNVDTLTTVIPDMPELATGPLVNLTDLVPPSDETGPALTPEPPKVAVIANPRWIRQPTGDQLMRAYPDSAVGAGAAGRAALSCVVQANGSVSDCVVTSESPGGFGFGRSAQSLSRHFRISPRTVDGQAVEGARVAINLRFTLPED